MNSYLRSIFIISFSLFTFISNGIAQQVSSENTGEVNECTNYTIDVQLEHYELSPNRTDMITDEIKMGLLFSLRRNSTQEPIQIVGIGQSNNFNGYFATPPPLFGFNGPFRFLPVLPVGGQSVLDVMRLAIRDGYEALAEYLSEQQRLGKVESQVGDDRVLISLGQSHYVQEGDVFHIYSEGGGSDNCNIDKDTEAYLATGVVIDTSDSISMLRINESGIGRVQEGDIVEFDPSIDLALRGEGDPSQVKALQIGDISESFVHFVSHRYKELNYLRNRQRTITRDITLYIQYYLVEEAPRSGLQVVQ